MDLVTLGATIIAPIICYGLGYINLDSLKTMAHNIGYSISQHFKKFPFWDAQVEPALGKINETATAVSTSIIEGMQSD